MKKLIFTTCLLAVASVIVTADTQKIPAERNVLTVNNSLWPDVAGGGLWTPADTDTELWLDAADADTLWENILGTIPATNEVARWDDKSGNGRNFIMATGSLQPQYGVTNLNGLGLVYFDGTDFMGQSFSYKMRDVFAVFNSTRATTFGADYLLYSVDVNKPGIKGLTGTTTMQCDIKDRFDTTGQWYTNGVAASGLRQVDYAPLSDYKVCSVKGGDVSLTFNSLRLCRGPAGAAWEGNIAEIIIVDTDTSTEERQKYEGYLAWKWGLEGDLPAGHPYKDAPPTQ